MFKKQLLLITVALLFCVSLTNAANAQKPAAQPNVAGQEKTTAAAIYGEFKNNSYTNDLLGFSLSFSPGTWTMQDPALNAGDAKEGLEIMKTGDASKDKLLDQAFGTDKIIAGISNVTDDPKEMVEAMITVKKHSPKPASLKAATEATLKVVAGSNLKFAPGEVKMITLAGKETSVFDAEIEMEGIKLKQKTYTLMHNGYYINIVFTFLEKETGERMAGVMNTLKLK